METPIGIAAAAVAFPERKRDVASLFQVESAGLTPEIETRLGIKEVPIADGESGSDLAVRACQDALQRAALDVAQVDIIVDYSILPQEYLVPAWNMSNKLQHVLGGKKAFTVGFSGGGATNFLVALSSAAAMLQANQKLSSALLVAADVTIPGNRILNPADPVTVMGDSAAAVILKQGGEQALVLETELHSEGSYHDVCYIPGGALANPDQAELYRFVLDRARYDAAPKTETLKKLLDQILTRAGVDREELAFALYTNLSHVDQEEFSKALGFAPAQMDSNNLVSHGHLQGTDFVLNYLSMLEAGKVEKGRHFIVASHGMGFIAGISLLRM